MTPARLEITNKGVVGCDTTIRLDGIEIQNVLRRVRLDMQLGEIATAELEVVAWETTEVATDSVRVVVADESQDLLIKLGWTPPEAT